VRPGPGHCLPRPAGRYPRRRRATGSAFFSFVTKTIAPEGAANDLISQAADVTSGACRSPFLRYRRTGKILRMAPRRNCRPIEERYPFLAEASHPSKRPLLGFASIRPETRLVTRRARSRRLGRCSFRHVPAPKRRPLPGGRSRTFMRGD
jgi:hypothetical protein